MAGAARCGIRPGSQVCPAQECGTIPAPGMTRYLSRDEVLELHRLVLDQSGGSAGVLHPGGLDSALVQPQMTFGGTELYPDLADKAAVLGYSLICNHPFVDGNKRVGHAALETFLVLNGHELDAPVDEQE